MRACLSIGLALLIPISVVANPVVAEKVSLDMGTGSTCAWPELGEVVSVTIYIVPGTTLVEVGMDSIRIRLERTFGGVNLDQTNLTGGWHSGDPESEAGWVLDVPFCPAGEVNGYLAIGRIDYLYEGPPGLLVPLISSFETDTSWISCGGARVGFLSRLVGGVGMSPSGGCQSPVSDVTWGAIKALYR